MRRIARVHGLVAAPLPHLVFRHVPTWDGLSDHVRDHVSVEVRYDRVVAIREAGESALSCGSLIRTFT